MSVKLVFQDDEGTTLHNEDIIYDGLAPLPAQNELVHLPGGEKVTVVGRQIAYGGSKHGETEVQVIFICEREKRKTPIRIAKRRGV
jgi:hypothetical protein